MADKITHLSAIPRENDDVAKNCLEMLERAKEEIQENGVCAMVIGILDGPRQRHISAGCGPWFERLALSAALSSSISKEPGDDEG